MIAGKVCLGITQRRYEDIYSYWLESRLNEPMQQVTIEQMFVTMEEKGGVYSPFVPVDQSPNVNNHETPETDTLVLGMTIAEHLELNESATAEKTSNGHFTVVHIQPSERWLDTMMFGLDDNTLAAGTTAYFHIFDNGRNIDGNLTLTITAYGKGVLNINGTNLQMEDTAKDYEVTIPFMRLIPITAENDTIQILGYTTKKQ